MIRTNWSWNVGLWILVSTPFQLGALEQNLVDEVVAVVNRQSITMSEVWQEAVMVLVERQGQDGLLRKLTPEFLSETMEFLINQRVLLDESQRIGLAPVTDSEREELLEKFRQNFIDLESYRRFLFSFALSDTSIKEILARHLRVERLRYRKLQSMPEVSDQEVKGYYMKNRYSFGGNPFNVVAEAIRLKLRTQKREKMLSRWLFRLRKRSEVKVLVDPNRAEYWINQW